MNIASSVRAIIFFVIAVVGTQAEAAPVSGIQLGDMDRSVRPQDDLFAYANGTWLRTVPIPDDRSRYGVDSIMAERSLLQQRELIEAAESASDPSVRKIGDLYLSFMDEAGIEKTGVAPLGRDLKMIAAVHDTAGVTALFAALDRLGVRSPIDSSVAPDAKRSSRNALWLSQGGLGLPDRDYYLSDDAELIAFRSKYREHITSMLSLLGDENARAEADDIVGLETAIAGIQWSNVANRDPQKTYNPRSVVQLGVLAPGIDWKLFLSRAGVQLERSPTLIAVQPDYLQHLSGLLHSVPIATWKEYCRFQLLSKWAPYLPRVFVDEDFAFNEGVLRGTPQMPERWKRGTELVDRNLGEESGKLYVAKYFPPQAKARIDVLVRNLLSAYSQSIVDLDWMSPATKVEAQAKLAKINVKVGYPARWRDYSTLAISKVDLFGNVRRAQQFETNRKLAQLGGPVDRNEWSMTTPTVNAYYNPSVNEIVFPAGILQPPAYNPAGDDAFNYGSAGATIGHEISHGFDDEGSQFDSDGNLHDWWSAEDHEKFKLKTEKLIKEYSAFEPVPGYKVNGELTLGENIADIAGVEIAYKAYTQSQGGREPPVIDGLTGEQRFYVGFAQSWLSKTRDSLAIEEVKSDPHSPEKYRTNGVVVHMPSYYRAFDVKPGDKMYLLPEDRVTLW